MEVINKMESKYGNCSECSTPLISPKPGYIVCPNCGLIEYDYQISFLPPRYQEEMKPKSHGSKIDLKKLKKWDRVSYQEARAIYVKSYYQAVFGRYVSTNILNEITALVIKELDKEAKNEKDKRQWHLNARFMKYLSDFVSVEFINKVFQEKPEVVKDMISLAKPKQIKIDQNKETLELIDKLAKFNQTHANYAKKFYMNNSVHFRYYTPVVRAIASMAYAESSFTKKKQTRISDYATELGANVRVCQKALKTIRERVQGGKNE